MTRLPTPGAGAADQIGFDLAGLGVRRVLVVTMDGPENRADTLADWSAPRDRSGDDRSGKKDLDALALLASDPYRQLLESEGGLFNNQVDMSFRWAMSWFISWLFTSTPLAWPISDRSRPRRTRRSAIAW